MRNANWNAERPQPAKRQLRRKTVVGAAIVAVIGALAAVTGIAHADTTSTGPKAGAPLYSIRVYNAGAFTAWAVVRTASGDIFGTVPKNPDDNQSAPDIDVQATVRASFRAIEGEHVTVQGGAREGRSESLQIDPVAGGTYCFRFDGTTQVGFSFSPTGC